MSLNSLFYRRQQFIGFRRFLEKSFCEGEENFVGDSEIIALGGASNETKDRPLG